LTKITGYFHFEMALIIDSHTHIFPDRLKQLAPAMAQAPLDELRKRARNWLKPVMGSMHKAQTFLRHLPEPARRTLDELGGIAPIPSLIFESTVTDLIEAMEDASVNRALVLAHPPLITNEFLLDRCSEHPELFPVVNIPSGTARPGTALKGYVSRGAVALKIHPAADGEGVDSPRYKALLKAANELGLPVIIHTGCFHTHLFYKDPEQGQAQRYAPWFETYRDVQFVLAHMNFHEPNVALDLMEEHGNVHVDTSWQPAEVIGEAVRRVGPDRVLFGTDWPFIGNNFNVGLKRVQDCIEAGTMTEAQSLQILGQNAAKLFKIE
jgi:predicted TIM-barrel fold metal-dependent hydrolase